jgi:hypothetical protein
MQVRNMRMRPTKNGRLRLLPNINRSGRALPDSVSSEDLRDNVLVDSERPTRKLADREIYGFIVEVTPAELNAQPELSLEVRFAAGLFQVLDQSGVPRWGVGRSPVLIPLIEAHKNSTKGAIQIFLEALSFRGSPLVEPSAPTGVTFRFVSGDTVVAEQLLTDGYEVTTADVILLGDDASAERLYLCDVGDNGPSVIEVSAAARAADVPLTVVPLSVNLGDSWLQDQFQMGYSATPDGQQRVIIHLPRVAHDGSLVPGTPNLRNFTDTYFPSDTVGVVKDFWKRDTTVTDGTSSVTLGVAESFPVFRHLTRVLGLLDLVFGVMRSASGSADPKLEGNDYTDLYRVRQAIDTSLAQLAGYGSNSEEILTSIRSLRARVREITTFLHADGKIVRLQLQVKVRESSEVRMLEFTEDNRSALRDFYRDLKSLHGSGNYGGNIEVSPQFDGAPYGKIITGSIDYPPLIDFLTSRGKLHPRCSVYTRWLHVAHIDEIFAFTSPGSGGFGGLRADPMLAISLLERALSMQKSGVLVTRLFRGKKWIHEVAGALSEPKLPPQAYARLVGVNSPYDRSAFKKTEPESAKPYGDSAFHDDRRYLVASGLPVVSARYAAFATCADLLASCGVTNRAIDALFLSDTLRSPEDFLPRHFFGDLDRYRRDALPYRLDTVLKSEFRGMLVQRLPVFFDRMGDFVEGATQALIPAAVNLQTLGKHLLVPRPYGPRMRVPDAIAFIKELVASGAKVSTVPDAAFIRSRGLDRTWHWTRAGESVYSATLAKFPSTFDPQYDEMIVSLGASVATSTQTFDKPSTFHTMHSKDDLANHPKLEPETLLSIAGYFKDGFDEFRNYPVDFCAGDSAAAHPKQDKYEADITKVVDLIRRANPGVFDVDGAVISKTWIRVAIPEATVDLFELYTQLVLETAGAKVQWVDSWYYHVHSGGIHCATNVLRNRP